MPLGGYKDPRATYTCGVSRANSLVLRNCVYKEKNIDFLLQEFSVLALYMWSVYVPRGPTLEKSRTFFLEILPEILKSQVKSLKFPEIMKSLMKS